MSGGAEPKKKIRPNRLREGVTGDDVLGYRARGDSESLVLSRRARKALRSRVVGGAGSDRAVRGAAVGSDVGLRVKGRRRARNGRRKALGPSDDAAFSDHFGVL